MVARYFLVNGLVAAVRCFRLRPSLSVPISYASPGVQMIDGCCNSLGRYVSGTDLQGGFQWFCAGSCLDSFNSVVRITRKPSATLAFYFYQIPPEANGVSLVGRLKSLNVCLIWIVNSEISSQSQRHPSIKH